MSIEMPAVEVYALASMLGDASTDAEEIGSRLGGAPQVGGPLQPVLEGFLDGHRTAGRALAGELRWLGSTVAAVADSWARLDEALLRPSGRRSAE
jgi:hypothetical protein